jgi:hypothetical protein
MILIASAFPIESQRDQLDTSKVDPRAVGGKDGKKVDISHVANDDDGPLLCRLRQGGGR